MTGLVGAMGGLGGFFPPLLLGFFRDRIGRSCGRDFCCSRAAHWRLWVLNHSVFLPRQQAVEQALLAAVCARAAEQCVPEPGRRWRPRCW